MRLWGGRFAEETDERVAAFGRSVETDAVMAVDDIDGSIAHVDGLAAVGLVAPDEAALLRDGLRALRAEVEAGTFAWDPALEDVHLNVEAALAARIGSVAGKLHTGRSRNDQVVTDLRLWLRRTIADLDTRLLRLEDALVGLAERERDTISSPRAMPTTGSPPTTVRPSSSFTAIQRIRASSPPGARAATRS